MDYFGLDDIESVAYVDKDNNDVIIKFVGFPNELASTLFEVMFGQHKGLHKRIQNLLFGVIFFGYNEF